MQKDGVSASAAAASSSAAAAPWFRHWQRREEGLGGGALKRLKGIIFNPRHSTISRGTLAKYRVVNPYFAAPDVCVHLILGIVLALSFPPQPHTPYCFAEICACWFCGVSGYVGMTTWLSLFGETQTKWAQGKCADRKPKIRLGFKPSELGVIVSCVIIWARAANCETWRREKRVSWWKMVRFK